MRVLIDEPGAFLHACDLPIVPNIGDTVTYQNSPPAIETRRVVWRRIEADTTNGIARVIVGVEDKRPVDIDKLFGS